MSTPNVPTTAVAAALLERGETTDEEVADWLRGYAERRDPGDRERIILAHLDLADRLAGRYRNRPNTTPDDLRQTARVGLIGAVDRYDPARGTPFRPYAIASILGALKRYLRDATWSLRVPRSVKQHALGLLRVRDRLAHRGDRWPATGELATSLGITHEEATRAIQAAETRTTLSLDIPVDGEDATPLGALLPDPEPTVAPRTCWCCPSWSPPCRRPSGSRWCCTTSTERLCHAHAHASVVVLVEARDASEASALVQADRLRLEPAGLQDQPAQTESLGVPLQLDEEAAPHADATGGGCHVHALDRTVAWSRRRSRVVLGQLGIEPGDERLSGGAVQRLRDDAQGRLDMTSSTRRSAGQLLQQFGVGLHVAIHVCVCGGHGHGGTGTRQGLPHTAVRKPDP